MITSALGTPGDDDPRLDGSRFSIGIVQARFNIDITQALAQACLTELALLHVPDARIMLMQVPGALEIPIALATLAQKKAYQALIGIGCIIRGETYHFELVANESAAGITRVALDCRIPIVNAVLTTENLEQAVARQHDKGRYAARAAVEMANLCAAFA
ncbi:6,7-dimethyl-8-ribityllumazine synthase [Candidatus Symbiobacter mobilis]|uniref:6,7-dimethyl-8-ribityllumazine synthase n=1 Tax=Candidatus Symbiobacter mobilis CR TaxID=946483 RepID=U5N836_9BURK|nr:6,7-dimethyl-8-ribityllumazine synthase [Candidatus Symbiobacter mobilis]AGX87470.1 riboflavin synthase subunit beta [Candidatus Symbiobacter mobilis CR]